MGGLLMVDIAYFEIIVNNPSALLAGPDRSLHPVSRTSIT
jgi:hypothetical protein